MSEDRQVTVMGLLHAKRLTATSSEPEPVELEGHGYAGPADLWDVIDQATNPHQPPSDAALLEFGKSVRSIPGVLAVSHAKDHDRNLVWTFITARDKALRKQIYQCERALMARYPNLPFDFNVVALEQRAAGSLVPDDLQGRVVMYRPLPS